MYRLKENKRRREVSERVMNRGRETEGERERGVISGDLLLQRYFEVCPTDRSIMDFRMSYTHLCKSAVDAASCDFCAKSQRSSRAIH